ncbi:MAG: hypothetical protein ACRC0V_09290 [Fusobacteriaceae bacterium]
MKEKINNIVEILQKNIRYKLMFFIGIIIFLCFFIFGNIMSIKNQKIDLEQLMSKVEESNSKKKILEEKIIFIKSRENESESSKKQKEYLFIYDNASVFKINFEKKLKNYGFEYIESSRLEKKKIEGEVFFYEIKNYYEILGEIKKFNEMFFLSENEFYIIERENFIINFNEENSKIRFKIKFFSYEKKKESEKSNFDFGKMNVFFEETKEIKLGNSYYCIVKLENKRKKIVRKDSKVEEAKENLCK